MSPTLLILSRYVVPVRPRGQVLENYGVVVSHGRIEAIMPVDAALENFPDAERIELPRHVLLPGLINAHTHSPMTLMRGYADDLPMQEWLREHIWPAESQLVNAEYVRDGMVLAAAEMIRGGTTCFSELYFFPGVMASAVEEIGLRTVMGLPLLDQETPWARNFDEYLEKGMNVVSRFENQDLVTFSLAPHAPYSVSDPGFERIAEVSSETGMRVHLHCLETAFDAQHSMSTYGEQPLERLARLGLLNPSLIAVHMTQLDVKDCRLVAEAGAHVVHCPQSNMKLASGFCPVADLLSAGANVCLGTDGAASNNNLDLLEEARFASLLAKGVSNDATAVSAMETLEMMTINGAMALGLEEFVGSIEVGKQADLCAMDMAAVNTVPLHNLVSQVAYAASSSQVTDVWVAGRRLMQGRKLTTIQEDEVLDIAMNWQHRMEKISHPRAGQ